MSCAEKRHMSHRMGSMLHHRFPNGFTDLFMDETDREVSTLTDRAFRSLCIGDDAIYNDDFLYGYSPFSCHKPLAGEPLKKTHNKESKKQGQGKNDKHDAQPWKQQQQKNMSHMSSFLKALSATEESCEGMFIKNGGMTDSNGESWDKSALRSIQRELSEFSPDYHTNLADGSYKNNQRHPSGDASAHKKGKDASSSGKSSKSKNGKSGVKLKKLNIKNFFLHSEFSPFQTWGDLNRFPFSQEDIVTPMVPTDIVPKWYDLPFYKELTEAHRKETVHTEEAQPCQKAPVDPPPPVAPKPIPPPSPPKVLPKPLVTPAEKRCSSDIGDATAAPWRRNRSRAKSAIPANQSGAPPHETFTKPLEENLWLIKKEARSVEVKAVEEVSSLASTPFSICQLMTPLIPSRQPTETSEILSVLSPSALDLPLRPHSEAKVTPEPPIKRDSYKSLASSILFNLKDNRKRVKSRYSPPKFKTLEVPEDVAQSPQPDNATYQQAMSDGQASGLSTPAIVKEVEAFCNSVLEHNGTQSVDVTKQDADRPLSDDYLLSNLLQSKSGNLSEDNPMSPFMQKKNKSALAKKQNYPSLNLYKKASPVDGDMIHLQVPCDSVLSEKNDLSPFSPNKELSSKPLPTNTGLSPNTVNVSKDRSPVFSAREAEKEAPLSQITVGKIPPEVPEKPKRPLKNTNEKDYGVQGLSSTERDSGVQSLSTKSVIKAAREAINAAKTKALSIAHSDGVAKPVSKTEETKNTEIENNVVYSKDFLGSKQESVVPESNHVLSQINKEENIAQAVNKTAKKEPPPVPKRNFNKSDIQLPLDKQHTVNTDKLTNGDVEDTKDRGSVQKPGKVKHIFSARQNNYIKYQRYAETGDEQTEDDDESDINVSAKTENDEGELMPKKDARDSEHIVNDLHALKELERVRLGDRFLDNARSKFGLVNIDEETKAKNELISRELRNIKKGMLSMRGNTLAKREIFTKKEREHSKQDVFTKIDGNVIVNKALINDNYDKAKMALEEIISERQKRKNVETEQDANSISEEGAGDESYDKKAQQRRNSTKYSEVKEEPNASNVTPKDKELKERLSDLRDHTHMRQILAQTEPRAGETHRGGVRIALPGMDKIDYELSTLLKEKNIKEKISDMYNCDANHVDLKRTMSQVSEDSIEDLFHPSKSRKDVPPVPPRRRRDGSISSITDSIKDVAEEDNANKDGVYENGNLYLTAEIRSTSSEKQEVDEVEVSQSETSSNKDMCSPVNNIKPCPADSEVVETLLPFKLENRPYLSSEIRQNENKTNDVKKDMSSPRDITPENIVEAKEMRKVKRKAPLKPDYLNSPQDKEFSNSITEESPKVMKANEDVKADAESLSETPRSIISPLLLVNGVSINQSPPDQASCSSKSSYFSVESALHRNTESETNIFHSLENLLGDVEEVDEEIRNISQNTMPYSDRTEAEYYSFSDHESEPELAKHRIKSPEEEAEVPSKDKETDKNTTDQNVPEDENNLTAMLALNTLSPTLGIPALFKVKDNTAISNKVKKSVQPWTPRGSLSFSEKAEVEVPPMKEIPELPVDPEIPPIGSPVVTVESFKPTEIESKQSPLTVPLFNIPSETQTVHQDDGFLTVPQQDDRNSGVSPLSEGVESLTTSTVDTADEMIMSTGVECEVLKVPSERSGSTCSGNESQTSLPKPPTVLPKSEKAVLRAMKLTNRRIKKEEAQKSPNKSSQSSSKHRSDRHKSDKSEHKSSSSSSRSSKSSEKKHREKTEHNTERHNDHSELLPNERRSHNSQSHHERAHVSHNTRRPSYDSMENSTYRSDVTERQGRSSDRHIRERPEQRHYSSDRVISNVPVYKSQILDRPMSDRPFHRSLSTDRYFEGKVERRLSADISAGDPRTQRIEKSIMDELQQRGRGRDKPSRDNTLRRSHSIDAQSTVVPHPPNLSRQSSHTGQLSRQSSIEHTIVTQSFPMTQRKLLQDPDSGHYFFVDMPVQVKTKTFFDPETGSYVQLPIQPPEGAVPQASPMEVLTPPMVVYHGFVPVPLSPMAQKANIQAPHREHEERLMDRSIAMHCKEGHPYLEPVFGQHEHILGDFLGTEELDCPS